jgi:hypothetical protein
MKHLTWLLVVIVLFVLGAAWGVSVMDVTPASAAEPTVPVGGWCKVEAVNYDILVRATDCQTWVLACPTTTASCRWLPIERTEPTDTNR